ncbi:MAG TPA: GspE/PulE family protein [Actinomycetota bacterium]|nr:GspE/PulE family protein [Actinomycetota bacterium]
MKSDRRLGDVLLDSGVITVDQLRATLEIQKRSKGRRKLGTIAVDASFVSEEALAEALSKQLGLPFLDLRVISPERDAARMVPRGLALRHKLVPIRLTPTGVLVAMSDPTNLVALDDVRMSLGSIRAEVAVATASAILDSIERLFGMELAANDLSDPHDGRIAVVTEPETLDTLERSARSAPIVGLVNSMLINAVKARATDIHIEPQADYLKVRYRVDGLLREVLDIPKHSQSMIISRVKIMGGMDISERRHPQDGRATINIDHHSIDARMSSIPTFSGEKIVIRLLPTNPQTAEIDTLGFSESQLQLVHRHIDRAQGLIVFTGPTGAGKTSTMYAALDHLASPEKNVVTLEDPIEYQIPGLNQVQIDERADITFANGLRSILRQDPDVVMVGEIRDMETAQTVMQAALSGHLVLSSLHTRDTSSAVTRLVDLGVEPFLIASALNLVVAQRLVRLNCSDCTVPTQPPLHALAAIGDIGDIHADELMAGAGCGSCGHTGYRGRTGVFEVLPINNTIRGHISARSTEDRIRLEARSSGIPDLRSSALALAGRGMTTLEEVLRVTHDEADEPIPPPMLKAM